MRVKAPALVISFANVTEALAVEDACKAAGLPGRIIPVPREITAGCGLAWKAAPKPLSIFTTDTPLAQEFSMDSRADIPPREAP